MSICKDLHFLSQRYQKLSTTNFFTKDTSTPVTLKPKSPKQIPIKQKPEQVTHFKPTKDTSGSFNIAKLTQKQWESMHPTLKSKYLSYTIQEVEVQSFVEKCQKRFLNEKKVELLHKKPVG